MNNDVHPGSWSLLGFQLPDFGITESLGGNRTAQGGSNLLSNNTQGALNTYANPTPINFGAGGVTQTQLGASTSSFNPNSVVNTAQNTLNTVNNSTNPGGSGSTAGTSGTPTNTNPINSEIENAYNSSINYLNGLTNSLYANEPGIENEINSNYKTSAGNLGRSQQAAEGQIDQSQQAGEQRKTDALTAARNLYNELVQGGQQRFGGASSAGEAYQALAGRELQRNNQQIGTDFNTFMGQIVQAKNNLNMQYQNSLATLEQQRNSAIAQAQRDFQDKLNQINSMKDQANQTKATARINAMTDLRNQIFQINVASAQNASSVQNYAKQISDQLDNFAQTASNSTDAAMSGQQGFSANTNTNPNTALTIGGNNQGGNQPQMIGMVNQNDKDKQPLIGFVNPFDPRNQQLQSAFS